MLITVFTPTYNRAYIIGNLYQSLCNQNFNDFEWLVVDDGSSDNTEQVIDAFSQEHKINIRYIKQLNGGKHRAINKGVREANGELFFIVDSDDHLATNALQLVAKHYASIKDTPGYVGVSGVRAYPDGLRIGGDLDFVTLDCNCLDLRYKYCIIGDMAEIYRTEVLKDYPFPEIEGEKFCTEALVWNRIAQNYKLRYFNEKIYMCEYLADGLTRGFRKLNINNPKGMMIYYGELAKMQVPLRHRVESIINYWRYSFFTDYRFSEKISNICFLSVCFAPIGYLLYRKDKNEIKKSN